MSDGNRACNPLYSMLPTDVDGFDALAELALDLRWSWNHAADKLWRQLDSELWDMTQNPWGVLQTVSREKLQQVLDDPVFRKEVDDQLLQKRQAAESPAWFQQTYPQSALKSVAYFSMEFMLSEALPIYSGGLGNVAGDQLKAASDLGVPVIGVGLLYQQGYFRQVIDSDGTQQALYPYNDPGRLPITPLRRENGEWLRMQLDLPGYPIWLRAWQVQVGRVKLYLLDSNDAANYPPYRGITSELYVSEQDLRLMQELVLGIGGWRLLNELGIEPQVCHLNEGHAALAVLERARSFMKKTGQPFAVALAATRAGNLFTTHTAVAAGFDRYSPALIKQCLGGYAENQLGISLHDLMALGRQNPHDTLEHFNMTYLAMRGSSAVNGVSRLHAEVSRQLFAPLFPRWSVDEVPVSYVTNGVHVPTWDSAGADDLWTEVSGKERWLGTMDSMEKEVLAISDDKLWKLRCASRKSLVDYTRNRLARQLEASGSPSTAVEEARHVLDENILTIGFARRFATYKRPDLLLHDTERLLRLLNHHEYPIQLIIAGKAHPADKAGQDMIRHWVQFIRHPEARSRVIFLSDYDMHLAEHLVQGVDVWLNTPRRPWEASGTSGMKVLVNGGINLSELDGWWAEAYTSEVGWALGDGHEHGDDLVWDAHEADALYSLLEKEVAAEFYSRDAQGIPVAWAARMRASMSQLTSHFSSNRAVREYTEQHYIPAASAYIERADNKGEAGSRLAEWQQAIEQKWAGLRFAEVKVNTESGRHAFKVQIYLDGLDPAFVRVELYANGVKNGPPERHEMLQVRELIGATGGYVYAVSVPDTRSSADYTARVIPDFKGASVPLECHHILWQH